MRESNWNFVAHGCVLYNDWLEFNFGQMLRRMSSPLISHKRDDQLLLRMCRQGVYIRITGAQELGVCGKLLLKDFNWS
jgi:hypothetical protein